MTTLHSLQELDYVILGVVSVASLGIGIYFACMGGKQKTTNEYFKGDSNMNIIPIVMSMMAGFVTSNAMLGVPAEVYHYGFNHWYGYLGALVAGPIVIYGFMPVFYKLQITSICEYIQYRFNTSARIYSSFLSIFTLTVVLSFTTYAPALALNQVTGLSVWQSVLITTVVGTIYTSIGGIKAVIWTDALQLLILTAALFAAIIKGCIDVGGVSNIYSKNVEGKRLSTLSFSPDPRIRYSFWGLLISSTVRNMFLYGISQMQLQRYMCCPNKATARKSIWLNLICFIPIATIYCFIGLILYAVYWNCDPLSSHQIEKHDQLFPLFVMDSMASIPGMPGLFVAGVYSAALSTMSSLLNSLTALTLIDHIKPRWKQLSDQRLALISKFISVGYGLLCLLVIAALINLGSIVQAMEYLTGGTMGSTLGLFFLGLMNPWANSKGSILGITCGLGISWWITLGNKIFRPVPASVLPVFTTNCSNVISTWEPSTIVNSNGEDILEIYKISYLWIMPIAFSVTVIVGSISSLCIGSNESLDMKLLSPFVHSIMKKLFSNKYTALQLKYNSLSQKDEITVETRFITK